MNAVEIEQAITNLAEQPFDPSEFPYAFLEAFGNKATTIKRLRAGASNKSDLGGVLQTSNIHILTCDRGEVTAALAALKASAATVKAKAKFILATDGEDFEAEDLIGGDTVACAFNDFPDHFGFFLPLGGISTVREISENAFDIRATSRLNRLYIELLKDNPDWATAERRHDMNNLMARLIFCFFAEDTDIFIGKGRFTETIAKMSAKDSSNTHEVVATLFRAMNTKREERAAAKIPRWAEDFPYVNGQLFSSGDEVPQFSKIARSYLLHVGRLDWTKINPDIFGSMIQAVAEDEERGELGMHYTSVPNILKVLNPLFLDELRAKLEEAGDNPRTLLNLRKRIAKIRVFDPACGSGNFLVIAYKEMRAIEAEINRRRSEPDRASEIPITNFRGIELRDFPAEIARLALVITEYQCDVLYRGQKLALAEFLPLRNENWITCGNALRLDWLGICPPEGRGVKVQSDDLFGTPLDQAEIDFESEDGETFVCGNPPFKGARKQSPEQKTDLCDLFGGGNDYKDCDYVSGWYLKGAAYIRSSQGALAFVSTSSVCEGEQVQHVWGRVFNQGCQIIFAHRPFAWRNNASNNAMVTCVIVGMSNGNGRSTSGIFDGETFRSCSSISPYLVPGPTTFVTSADSPISGDLSKVVAGSMPRDGGHLLLNESEKQELIREHPEAHAILKRLSGTSELTGGVVRWCLWINDDSDLDWAIRIPPIHQRIENVRRFRLGSSAKTTQGYARIPHKFAQRSHKSGRAIIVSATSSENREYLPADICDDKLVVSNAAYAIYGGSPYELSIVVSKLHLAWVAAVCGRMKTDFRFSKTLGWNTFPLPTLTDKNKADLTRCAEEILLAREHHFPATIAELYDPEQMPADLRAAHDRNDEVLERIYIGRRFKNDTERLEKLFDLYTKMITSAAPAGGKKRKTGADA
ncbi:class I SAM-dependent DNA methyltransferase [Pseudomonas viridiflava]|uniref:class I SAM-dependent DNA methyltransferase n=1 Tax=Pseudomonas viridiflava TaxID=33069 RepID=UPI002A6B58BC|nr:DNA methyltransferase [Pseudomonas viridiflava]MDY0916258.1 DNA methyltransferase [Pseudomonas viridiflava]